MKILHLLIIILMAGSPAMAGIIAGTVTDAESKESIPFVSIRVIGTSQSIIANEQGRYRLTLSEGSHKLKFSHVAHYSRTVDVEVHEGTKVLDVELEPALVEVAPIKVYDRAYDAAQRIIVEAIARKEAILTRLRQYNFEAYTKLVLRDKNKDDSVNIFLITETQLESHWKYPDHYKEIITARRQTSNIEAEQNLVSLGEILNFNKNRIDFGEAAVVSPTASDALDYYDYYLMDTVYNYDTPVFVLEIEPKSNTTPLFVGTIKIADSSFAVVGVDVELNDGYESQIISSPRYSQTYAQFEQEYWMPTLIQFAAEVDVNLPGVPEFTLDYSAACQNYSFDSNSTVLEFDEFALEVDSDADNTDSSSWLTGQLIPLTDEESDGYNRVDSIENAPKPVYKKLLSLVPAAIFLAGSSQDFFHFNRAEGSYFGVGHEFRRIRDRLSLRIKTGYAIDAELWQHRYGVNYLLSKKQKLTVDFEYRDEARTLTTIQSRPNGNATLLALIDRFDPYDYYREKGITATIKTKLIDHSRLGVKYTDVEQFTMDTANSYNILGLDDTLRINPAIDDGRLRSTTLYLSFDSRKLMKDRGRESKLYAFPFTLFEAGVEYASDDLFATDFDFTRYYAWLYRDQRLPGWGMISVYIYGGASNGTLPPQKYFVADFGLHLIEKPTSFQTMGDANFYGSRLLLAYGRHDFGTKLFKKSHLPLIEKIPYRLNIHGGAFYTDFKNNPVQPGDELLDDASGWYSELGFGLAGFLPLGMGIDLTWQLSDYDTNGFAFGIYGRF